MTSKSVSRDLYRSGTYQRSPSSPPPPPPPMINTKHQTHSLLSACCTCSRTPRPPNARQFAPALPTDHRAKVVDEPPKTDVHKGFFKRIEYFKGETAKRRESHRHSRSFSSKEAECGSQAAASRSRSRRRLSDGSDIGVGDLQQPFDE